MIANKKSSILMHKISFFQYANSINDDIVLRIGTLKTNISCNIEHSLYRTFLIAQFLRRNIIRISRLTQPKFYIKCMNGNPVIRCLSCKSQLFCNCWVQTKMQCILWIVVIESRETDYNMFPIKEIEFVVKPINIA